MSPQDLLARHPELWHRATRHPFLDGVRDGSLPEESFRRWLVQDYHFVRGLLPAQAYVLAASLRPDQRVLASGLVGLAEELDWFEQHARPRGLSLEVAVHPTCRAYVDFLLENCTVRALASASPSEQATAEDAFRQVAEYEAAFWNMAWRGGRV